jgi:hypothetical protein
MGLNQQNQRLLLDPLDLLDNMTQLLLLVVLLKDLQNQTNQRDHLLNRVRGNLDRLSALSQLYVHLCLVAIGS